MERDELRKQCPRCGKVVKLYDALCMRCGNELDFPEVAIEPESVARSPIRVAILAVVPVSRKGGRACVRSMPSWSA